MTIPTTNDFAYFTLAVLLGLLGNALLNDAEWGMNLTLWLLATLAVAYYLRRHGDYAQLGRVVWVAVAFSVLFTWRDSPVLHWLALGAIGAAVAISSLGRLAPAPTLLQYVGVCADAVCTAYPVLFRRMPSATVAVYRRDVLRVPIVERILRGLLLSVLPVFVFGWLLIAADANFQKLVTNVFVFDPLEIADAASAVFIWGLLACVIFYVLTTGPLMHVEQPALVTPKAFGGVELNVVLAVLNLLFLAFVSTQFEYLFGGHARIAAEENLTYADYGRRGFFELATVAVLSFGMLVACNVFVRREERTARVVFVALALLHIVLVGVIIASGFHRMGVYIETYSLTQLRFYVCAGMAWVALQFVGLTLAILIARGGFLPWFLTRTAFAAVFVLYAVNPDAWVARANVYREFSVVGFDTDNAMNLSADATPTLVRGLPALPPGEREELHTALQQRRLAQDAPRLFEFNLSRYRAQRALQNLD